MVTITPEVQALVKNVNTDWGNQNPIRPENKQMVKDFGVEVTTHPNRGASIDMYSDEFEVRVHNNDAGKHIKNITLKPNRVVVSYDDNRPEKSFPLEVLRDVDGKALFSASEINMSLAEPREKAFDIAIVQPKDEEKTNLNLERNVRLNLQGKNWTEKQAIDISQSGPDLRIDSSAPTQATITGLSATQEKALKEISPKKRDEFRAARFVDLPELKLGAGYNGSMSVMVDGKEDTIAAAAKNDALPRALPKKGAGR